ncbi:MAG TPA: hypothetical protein VMW27_17770, partial [Thermoanaerobaculia bacterium]|nr:hypothetical protein [Thermoanaerobaculia bacterium]
MDSAGTLSVAPYLEAVPAEIAPLLAPLVERLSSFLGPRPASLASGKRSIALFDAGPGQLGGPRIAQLAILIALTQRAEAAGARFAWGILQEPQTLLIAGATREALHRLTFARTPREATQPQIEAWRLRLEEDERAGDLWVVGAPRLGSPPALPGASHLQIWDALEPGARRTFLACRRWQGAADETVLDLPEDADCVRLLRALASLARRQEEREPPVAEWEDPPRLAPLAAVDPRDRPLEAPRPRAGGVPGSRLATVFHRLTGRTALASRLSRAVRRHHAAYARKLRELFESGDFDSALRFAIPLTAEAGPRRLPLRSFSPRAELQIRPERSRGWSAAELSPDLHGELRRLYREAFHRLEGQGRIEEAAFVLAEVLHAHEEAVAFLERHGRLRLAAEMAEARDLPAGLVIRQWFLAGDRQRGLQIAHRTGAFADAVTRLERSARRPEAAELRRLWASELAAAGDYAAAVDVLWSLPEERQRAVEWMDLAIGLGGAPAGRMLARMVALAP